MTNSKWMLLAEDNLHDAELMLRALSANQFSQDVIVTRDGAEALDCLYGRQRFQGRNTGNPCVVLLDLNMPKVNGLEVLQRMRYDSQLKRIPVVLFTSTRAAANVLRSYDLGVNAFVVKPVDFKQFISVVQELKRFWMELNEPPPAPAQPDKNIFSPAPLSATA